MAAWLLSLQPILGRELLALARRFRYFALRTSYGVVLMMIGWLVWSSFVGQNVYQMGMSVLTRVAETIFLLMMALQFLAVWLLTPILVIGPIHQERAEGTLAILLTTPLTVRQILVGKMIARLLKLTLIILSGTPVLMLLLLVGGIDPDLLLRCEAATVWYLLLHGSACCWLACRLDRIDYKMFFALGMGPLLFLLTGPLAIIAIGHFRWSSSVTDSLVWLSLLLGLTAMFWFYAQAERTFALPHRLFQSTQRAFSGRRSSLSLLATHVGLWPRLLTHRRQKVDRQPPVAQHLDDHRSLVDFTFLLLPILLPLCLLFLPVLAVLSHVLIWALPLLVLAYWVLVTHHATSSPFTDRRQGMLDLLLATPLTPGEFWVGIRNTSFLKLYWPTLGMLNLMPLAWMIRQTHHLPWSWSWVAVGALWTVMLWQLGVMLALICQRPPEANTIAVLTAGLLVLTTIFDWEWRHYRLGRPGSSWWWDWIERHCLSVLMDPMVLLTLSIVALVGGCWLVRGRIVPSRLGVLIHLLSLAWFVINVAHLFLAHKLWADRNLILGAALGLCITLASGLLFFRRFDWLVGRAEQHRLGQWRASQPSTDARPVPLLRSS